MMKLIVAFRNFANEPKFKLSRRHRAQSQLADIILLQSKIENTFHVVEGRKSS